VGGFPKLLAHQGLGKKRSERQAMRNSRPVIAMAHQSPDLGACQDLCTELSHLGPRPGARHARIDTVFRSPGSKPLHRDCIVTNATGDEVSGVDLARACIAEWERILTLQNLSIAWQSDISYNFSPASD